jgi:L-seryl-tRNA(Ser) seleniumtransferase
LDDLRHQLAEGAEDAAPDAPELAERTRRALDAMDTPSLRRVINATGIPLHTNLGRAPLPSAVREALAEVSVGYTNLEYDLDKGTRGSRHDHCAALLMELTGAGGALIVNNNAAAVVLAVDELAHGREVVVSRGELVEIGGSFRVPDIVAKSGARIVEVGTTNRTHARDYEGAMGPETGALLKVHQSNFRQSGFVAEVDIDELAEIAHRRDIPVIHDLGSGLLPEAESLGLPWEPSVRGSLHAGADIVTFSGDKLLGGPQAGVIVGRAELIERLRKNPLLRALRVGKLTIAALEATLREWRDEGVARSEIPAMALIVADSDALRQRAERIADMLRGKAPGVEIEVAGDVTEIGGGSYPGAELETWVVRIKVGSRSERELEAACRAGDPPVIGRVRDDALVLDPRTVLSGEEDGFIERVAEVLKGNG